jgi:nickel-dependent lactate racemase
MARVELPWGSTALSVELPRRWRLRGILKPSPLEAPADVAGACREALQGPIDSQPLRARTLSGARVVIVVDDHSRPTPVASFLPPVLEELRAAGASEERIEILIATGVHRASRPEEVARKLGPELAARLRWRCHDAQDPSALGDLGTTSRGTRVLLNRLLTEADLILCLGAIEPHLLLGFGGGLKMIVPGCAGAVTIGRNHMQGVDPDHFDYVGADAERSPMRLDLEEAAGKLGREVFIVNAVINERGEPARFFCGDPIAAHRAGVELVRSRVALEVPEPADVVLTSSYPMDADLRQSVKCLGNSLHAVREGGVLLGCVRCENGLGEIPIPKRTLPYALLRLLLKVIGKRRVLPLVERVKRGEPVEEIFVGHFGLQMLRRNHLGLYSPSLPADTGRRLGMVRTFHELDGLLRWAEQRAPSRATVWVVPMGGASYAAG